MSKTIGIYKITSPSNKIYVGQSTNIEKRWRIYSNINCKGQTKLYNSFLKYGIENHIFEIIEECLIEQLNEREIYWGEYYNTLNEGLNLKLGNGVGTLTNEIKNKISNSSFGVRKTKSHRDNISKARKGMNFTQTHKDNMSKSRFRYKILCLNNNIIYKSANDASKKLNLYPSAIIGVCKGIYNHTNNFKFKFVEDEK